MIIYFINANKIYTYKLPLKIVGNYILNDYDSNGIKRNLVSVSVQDGSWIMHDNDEVKIISNNSYVSSMKIELFSFYELVAYGTERIFMYVMPYYDSSFVAKYMADNTSITIGKSSNSDVCYNYLNLGEEQAVITYQNNHYSIKNVNLAIPLFINNQRKDSAILNNFDVIFLMGLNIVVLGNKLFINNPGNKVAFGSGKFVSASETYLVAETKGTSDLYKDFYDEKDYFYKMPTFKKTLVKYNYNLASPPQKNNNTYSPLIMTMIPTLLMAGTSIFTFINVFTNKADPTTKMLEVIMAVGLLVGTFLWPFIERFYEKYIDRRMERKRQTIYRAYLKRKEFELSEENANQKQTIKFRYLALEDCATAVKNKNANLFSRDYSSNDFLDIVLGVGTADLNADINYSKQEYVVDEDVLMDEAEKIIEKYNHIDDCPYVLNLFEKNVIAFIGPDEIKANYINALILQLITYHSYEDLKIVILTDNSCTPSFKFLKNTNFCFNNEHSYRYYADTFEEGLLLSDYLEKEFNKRLSEGLDNPEGKSSNKLPYYLIISDNISLYKNVKIVKDLLQYDGNQGFGVMVFDSKVANIPEGVDHFVNYNRDEGNYFKTEMESNVLRKFKPTMIGVGNNIDVDEIIACSANTPMKLEVNAEGKLPASLGFLEMYGVGNVNQLNVVEKWNNSNIVSSLKAPIGVDTNSNTLYLDLHEKRHGPHGLIAGMTGSGKSEFIITYILSLSVNYSPDEVQFVLIDYKGGGLAGAFENRKTGVKLPHLVGTITNLDKSEMKRTLVSVKSELQRRQRMFNEAKEKLNTGTIDIYKYQRLVREKKLEKPLSHLFIICDEFAELKAQQPDFMDELISTARIGRSLGVHLILATQKPSGVVDDQIWSNSKFKVCCKVQTAEDSKEMIKRDDAAYLKEAGRFYLQVGYDEYFVLGQSAYSGTKYVPSDKIKSKISNSIDFVNNQGEIIKSIDEDNKASEVSTANNGEELTNILQYIIEKAKESGYQNQKLWLDNIPREIFVDNINKKYSEGVKYGIINPLIGEYDDPKNQSQGSVHLNINEAGNTFICGVAGSGKSTLLSTIIYQTIITHNTKEVNFYIIDLMSESLLQFAFAPQVGGALTSNDKEEVKTLMNFLKVENNKRKKYYSKNGGNFQLDLDKGVCTFPSIIVIINGMDSLKEQFESEVDDVMAPLTRDCAKNGIYFIVTGTGFNSLGFSLENNFTNSVLLRMPDPNDYDIYGLPLEERIVPNTNPGRGLIKTSGVYEFQVALIDSFDKINDKVKIVIDALNNAVKEKAKPIPTIPSKVGLSTFSGENIAINNLPIGLELDSACTYTYNFNHYINIITYAKDPSVRAFLPALVDLIAALNNMNVIVFSLTENMLIQNEKVKVYKENFISIIGALYKNFEKLVEQNNDKNYTIIVDGISLLTRHFENQSAEDGSIKNINDLIMLTSSLSNVKFILLDQISQLQSVDNYPWYSLVNLSDGIIIGSGVDDQELFSTQTSYTNRAIARDQAVVLTDGVQNYVKVVTK